jgi:hypothetical protein
MYIIFLLVIVSVLVIVLATQLQVLRNKRNKIDELIEAKVTVCPHEVPELQEMTPFHKSGGKT